MAKLTIKQLQEENSKLKQEIKEQNQSYVDLMKKMHEMQEKADRDFQSSIYYEQMQIELEQYKNYKELCNSIEAKRNEENKINIELKKEIQQLNNEIESLDKSYIIHNERGAGRKSTITTECKTEIINNRLNGMTIKELSQKYAYSVGTIHKLISENSNKQAEI